MKRIVIAIAALAFATSAFADAAATYAKKCAVCHGKAGEGAKMSPKPIAGVAVEQQKKAITEGVGKMKPVKIEDVDEVAAYAAGLGK